MNDDWVMRWRGIDGGMQLDKLVGGESESQGRLCLELHETQAEGTRFVGVDLEFEMLYSRFERKRRVIWEKTKPQTAQSPVRHGTILKESGRIFIDLNGKRRVRN
jgi:hypothetical protein